MKRHSVIVVCVLFLALFTVGVFYNIYHHKESLPSALVTQTKSLSSTNPESNLVTTPDRTATLNQESQLQESYSPEERRELLLHEVAQQEITMTNDTVDSFVTNIKTMSGLDDRGFSQFLTDNGYTLEGYRKELSDALAISQLLEQELHLSDVKASDHDVDKFMEEHQGEFAEILEIDPDMEEYLQGRVQRTLTREKQEKLVQEYLKTLE
ncbi:hypothetical protein HYW21_08545 [Candidatus Woesearchaeota archaeon]|nr:hypothetical protein [Candidatus Woesearchaeota archaeon]